MATGYWPVRRLRQKTCVPVGVAVLAQQLPRGSHSRSRVSARIHCQGPRLDMKNMLHSFSGTDVMAAVASFLRIRAFGRFLCSEKHVCDEESLWNILLRWVSRSVWGLSVRSARACISKMMCRPYGVWPDDARNSCARLSNYRWCLDLCYCEYQVFSAVGPVEPASDENAGDFRSLFRDGFAGGERIANLLPVDQLPLRALQLIDNAWNETTDPVWRSRGWTRDLQLLQEFRADKMICSLWLFDLDSREVIAGICRDADWGSYSGRFRFYISERFEWLHLWDGWSVDPVPDVTPYRAGRVLEIWIPFKCSCNVQGSYDLSCSIEIFVADGKDHPEDPGTGGDPSGSDPPGDPQLVWERQRAHPWDLMCALSGCTLRSAVPDTEV